MPDVDDALRRNEVVLHLAAEDVRAASHDHGLAEFLAELKRRKVFRVAAVYGATAFVILQLADIVFPPLGLPQWTITLVVALAGDHRNAEVTPRTRAILAVHLAGWPCEMDALLALAERHGLYVIEDCAQAHGARYRGRSVGCLGHVGCWSFCQDKIMTTGGEGGMVTTSDRALWQRMWAYKDHGKSWQAVYEREHPPGFRWLHESFGTNWRMTEMQAAVGRTQLTRLRAWKAARRANATRIWQAARGCAGLRVPQAPAHVEHAAYKAYVFVEPERLAAGWNRDRIIAEIVARGVPCFSGSCSEVYREKAFDGTGWRPSRPLPVARELGETSLMFLCHPTLTEAEIDTTCAVLDEVMAEAVGRGGHSAGRGIGPRPVKERQP